MLASQKWCFFGTFVCTSKGYVERERGALFRARFARLSKVVVFYGTFACTSKGYVERELLSLCSREGALYRARIVRLSKGVVFVALLGAPVRGM